MIAFLLDHDIDVSVQDYIYGSSPLHQLFVLGYMKWEDREDKCLLYLDKLIENGVDINIEKFAGETPLHSLCDEFHSVKILQNVIKLDGYINSTHRQGRTALHTFVVGHKLQCTVMEDMCQGMADVLQEFYEKSKVFLMALLDYGLYINVKDYNGCSPLLVAVDTENGQAVSLLLEYGADVGSQPYTTLCWQT